MVECGGHVERSEIPQHNIGIERSEIPQHNIGIERSEIPQQREKSFKCFENLIFGELAEWLNAAVLKTVEGASLPGVRIPDSPH